MPTPTVSGRTRIYSIPNIAYHKMIFLGIGITNVGPIDARIVTGVCTYNLYRKDDSNQMFGQVTVNFNEIRVTTYSTSVNPDNWPFTLDTLISFG